MPLKTTRYESVHEIGTVAGTNRPLTTTVGIGILYDGPTWCAVLNELAVHGASADEARIELVQKLRKIADELDATKIP